MELLEGHSENCRIAQNRDVSASGRWASPVVCDSGASVWLSCNDPECPAIVVIRENKWSAMIEAEMSRPN